jgi:hypothetical protein
VGLRYDITNKYDDKINYDNKSNLPVFNIILTRFVNTVKAFFLYFRKLFDGVDLFK